MDDFRFRRYNLVDEKQYEVELEYIQKKIEEVKKENEEYKTHHLSVFGEDKLDSLLIDYIKKVLIEMEKKERNERIDIIVNKIKYDATKTQIGLLKELFDETNEKYEVKLKNNRISREKATKKEFEIMDQIVTSRLLRKGINSLSEINYNFNELIEMLYTLKDIGNSDFFASGFMNSILISDKITFVQNKINKVRYLFDCSQVYLKGSGMAFEVDDFLDGFYLGEYLFKGILITDNDGFKLLVDKIHDKSNNIMKLLEIYKKEYNQIIKKIEQWEYKMDINN